MAPIRVDVKSKKKGGGSGGGWLLIAFIALAILAFVAADLVV
jgi:hypothetical protein